jgi:unsaturated rhamnogalacturonyl hydrolase
MNLKISYLIAALTLVLFTAGCKIASVKPSDKIAITESKKEVLNIINVVNKHWQETHPQPGIAFWNVAAYHTGNMEAYKITQKKEYLDYSLAWANKNQWMGAKSQNKADWKFNYGENDNHVLFGDWQICFQTYIDLYNFTGKKDPRKIARAREVMEYEMGTAENKYWWWVDGLYMVMPVMTKLYKATGNELYLEKLDTYLNYANSIMYDEEAKLYFRDAKYIYPKHKTADGKKDFWARGDGWIFAGYAKIIQDLPNGTQKKKYIQRFQDMAKAIAAAQQEQGYWTRSMLDPEQAIGPETSGTAFFTYGFLWGINNGFLAKEPYLPVVKKSWGYLTKTALQIDGTVGYVQPIGEKAIPGQVVDKNSTADFGVGAFLLAASEMYRYLNIR